MELADATEGWPVGLYLAALFRRNNADPPCRLSDSTATIVSSSTTCVRRCSRLSRERQRFLTRTSILDHLNGPLCDAVLGRSGSARAGVHRTAEPPPRATGSSARVVPLQQPVPRRAPRGAARREPEVIQELHGRAADRFEELGRLEDALVHAHASGDEDRGRVAPTRGSRLLSGRADRHLRRWLDLLGEDVIAGTGLALMAA